MKTTPNDAGGKECDLNRAYICAFCGIRFQVPVTQRLSIRYVGRVPEVECPACRRQREDAPAANP
jgi:hypothetical protein